MTRLSWVALHGMARSFIELDKGVVPVIRLVWLVFCDCGFQSALWWRRIRGLWKLPDGRDWLRGKLGLVLMGGTMFSKSLIQFSVDRWGCVASLLFDLKPNYGGSNEDNATSFKRSQPCWAQFPRPYNHHRPMPPLETPGHSCTSLGQSLVGSLLLSPGSWCTQFCFCPLRVCFPIPV